MGLMPAHPNRTIRKNGPVVELVDALDSKSSARKGVGVRFSPGPPFSFKILNKINLISISITLGRHKVDKIFQ